jgi:hypothetical protein
MRITLRGASDRCRVIFSAGIMSRTLAYRQGGRYAAALRHALILVAREGLAD